MGKIYFFGNGIIKHNGVTLSSYQYSDLEEIIFEFVPFAGNDKAIPYAVSLKVDYDELICESELITIIKWGSDYELRFKPLIIDSYIPPEAKAQETTYVNDEELTVTVYQDTKTRIIVEGTGVFLTHTALCNISEPEIKMNTVNNKTVVAITGKSYSNTYLNIMMITKKCKILYEAVADKITYNKNNIKVSKCLKDMKGRILHTTLTYNGTNYTEESRKYEYATNHEYKSKLIPYLLLEAIIAKDIDDAKSYLSENLDASALNEFFGNIVEISEPKYCEYEENHLAVVSGKGNYLNATVYKFELENDLITNIVEV